MKHNTLSDRYQVSFRLPDEQIVDESPVMFPDAFAEKMDLIKQNFHLNPIPSL